MKSIVCLFMVTTKNMVTAMAIMNKLEVLETLNQKVQVRYLLKLSDLYWLEKKSHITTDLHKGGLIPRSNTFWD